MMILNLLRVLMLPLAGAIGLIVISVCEAHGDKVIEVLADDKDRLH